MQHIKNIMKKIISIIILAIAFTSCRTASSHSDVSQKQNKTQTIISDSNFIVLGSFTGTASERIMTGNIKNKKGIIAQAKANLLKKAKRKGVKLIGSRALVNVSVEILETKKRKTATMSAEIIEFK